MALTFMKWMIRILPLGYISLVWLQSALFNPESVETVPGLGFILEMGHLILFGIFYILLILALVTIGELTPRREAAAFIISLVFAIGDEIHQHYVSYRSASFVDLVKNGIGILAAWYLVRLVSKFTRVRR